MAKHLKADPLVETQALYTLLKGDEVVRLTLKSKISDAFFGYAELSDAYKIFERMLKTSCAYPTFELFLAQPDLKDIVKELLAKPELVKLENVDEVQDLVKILDYYRKIRVLKDDFISISKKLEEDYESKENAFESIDGVTKNLEDTLIKLRASDADDVPVYRLGKGYENFDPILESILSKKTNDIIPSTFNNFDSKVKGFNRGDLVFLASRAKGGKSTVALNMILRMFQQCCLNVAYISLEMSEKELGMKIEARLTGINHSKIRQKELTRQETIQVGEAHASLAEHGELNNCRFDIWCPARATLDEIYLRYRSLAYDVICIDYINLLGGDKKKSSDWEWLSDCGKEMKRIAKSLNALVIVPAQYNPKEGDMKYSKALKDHANNIWAWGYNENEQATHQIKIMQLVARNWATFDFYLEEDFEHGSVDDSNLQDKFNEG